MRAAALLLVVLSANADPLPAGGVRTPVVPRAITGVARAPLPTDPTRVLVVYNLIWPGSQAVAQHYAQRRGVPAQNLLGVQCSTGGSHAYAGLAGWAAFWDEVRVPVLNQLQTLGEDNIDVLLFCHGVPYELQLPDANGGTRTLDDVMRNPHWIGTRTAPNLPSLWPNPYHEPSPSRPIDKGAFSHSLYRYLGSNLWLTARLDGPTADAAIDLVESALYAERHLSPQSGFLRGYGYVDTRFAAYSDQELAQYPFFYGTYANADRCIAFSKYFVTNAGWPLKWENTSLAVEIGDARALFHDQTPATLAPAALWYAGWYNYGKYHDVWSWLPGSAACDVNSNSLQDLRVPAANSFLARAFARGLCCGTGCVTEPFLNGHPQPETLLYYLYAGLSFAEASTLCTPVMGWVNLAVGDPLYRPHRTGRMPIADVTPPPAPRLAAWGTTDTERVVQATIATSGREPDVVTARVDTGRTPALGQSVASATGYRLTHEILLRNLVADSLYYYRVTVTDPAALSTRSTPAIFYTKAFTPTLAGVNPPSQTATRPTPVPLDLTLGHRDGVWSLTGLQILITAPHLNVFDLDVTTILLGLGGSVATDPQLTLANVTIPFPSLLPAGSYTVRLRVSAGTVTTEDSGVIVVQ